MRPDQFLSTGMTWVAFGCVCILAFRFAVWISKR